MEDIKLLSIIIVSYLRLDNLQECLTSIRQNLAEPGHSEIIVIDNAGTNECRLICEQFAVQYINAGANLGVSGGRNLGIKMARGEFLFFIDDDAEAAAPHFDNLIRKNLNDLTGILACKVFNYYNNTPNPGELPFRVKNPSSIEKSRPVSYFVGAAFALNRRLIDEIGGFPEDFFYGAEELEFSYRALMHNWNIYYMAEITVLHKKSPIRITNKTRYFHTLRNRFIICARYIPFPYFLVNLGFWSLIMFFQSIRDQALGEWARGLARGWAEFSRERKKGQLLNHKTISYLKVHEGRLWY